MATAPLVLLAASLLRVPARRMRALALGDDGALRDWIANESATRLTEARRDARLAAARLEALGGRVVSLDAADYPVGLKDLSDPPPFLTVLGTLTHSPWRAGTAVVGTRTPDDAGARTPDDAGARKRLRRLSVVWRAASMQPHMKARFPREL